MIADLAVIGGGIVGLASAHAWQNRFPGSSVLVLEKEPVLGAHQTSRNSGVIHSGIYYRPGSLKAKLCVAGARQMIAFCRENAIPHAVLGKLIVATQARELPRLQQIYERGRANGIEGIDLVERERIQDFEPHAAGLRAIRVPSAGIVDYGVVATRIAEHIRRAGGEIRTGCRALRFKREAAKWHMETTLGSFSSRRLITCGGLYADRVARSAGAPDNVRIAPFRGEYYVLRQDRQSLVRSLIYPVPDPALPFLGVHFTRDIQGGVHAGPNAVLAGRREGYRRRDIDLGELAELACFQGFWKMAGRHWKTGMAEWSRSVCKPLFVRALQRLVPEVRSEDLLPAPAGVRAQALGADGALLDDFSIVQAEAAVHVRNVPSPAATAAFAVAQVIVEAASSH